MRSSTSTRSAASPWRPRVVEGGKVGDRGVREEGQRIREDRSVGHPCPPAGRGCHEPLAGEGKALPAPQLSKRLVGDGVERVDLPVRVRDGRADLGAAILEHEDVCQIVARPEGRAAVGPQVDDLARAADAERPEGRVVLWRVEDDLAARAGHGRPAVRKPPDVVRLRRLETTRAEGAGRLGEVGSCLARADHEHGRSGVSVVAEFGVRAGCVCSPRRRLGR